MSLYPTETLPSLVVGEFESISSDSRQARACHKYVCLDEFSPDTFCNAASVAWPHKSMTRLLSRPTSQHLLFLANRFGLLQDSPILLQVSPLYSRRHKTTTFTPFDGSLVLLCLPTLFVSVVFSVASVEACRALSLFLLLLPSFRRQALSSLFRLQSSFYYNNITFGCACLKQRDFCFRRLSPYSQLEASHVRSDFLEREINSGP